MPISTGGSGTPAMPRMPPTAMTVGKDHRQRDDQRPAEERPPQPDRNHRQQMVEAAQRMQEPGLEAAGEPRAGVRQRRCGKARSENDRHPSRTLTVA